MEVVNKIFIIYRYTKIVLLLDGLGLFFYFKQDAAKTFWVEPGMPLAIEAAVRLSADYFVEKRAGIYTTQLKAFVVTFLF